MSAVAELTLAVTTTSITAKWGLTGEPPVGWRVRYRLKGAGEWTTLEPIGPEPREALIAGLKPESEYEVDVEALGEEEGQDATASTLRNKWIVLPWTKDTGHDTLAGWLGSSADSGAYWNQWFGAPEPEPKPPSEEPEGEEAASTVTIDGPPSASVVSFDLRR